jgi:hypothetical protein
MDLDWFDRIELCVRFYILSVLGLFGMVNVRTFHKQLRRVDDILLSDDESDDEVQSEESGACAMAQGTFESVGDNETYGSSSAGESSEEVGSGEAAENESNESEDIEGGSSELSDDSFRVSDGVQQCSTSGRSVDP